MALNSLIFKVRLEIADIDASFYETRPVVIPQHPSEAFDRLIVRLLALALHSREGIEQGSELCVPDEPDLFRRNLTGDIEHWIDVGLPDERRIKRASRRSDQLTIYTYGTAADPWWARMAKKTRPFRNTRILLLDLDTDRLAGQLERSMDWQVTTHEAETNVTYDDQVYPVRIEVLQERLA